MAVIGILGTIHGDDENRKKMGYPIEVMKEAILNFKPDVICGEVRPEDWEKYCTDNSYEGYLGPYEYRNLIIPLCRENNIVFEPVDWFEMDLVKYEFDSMPGDKEKEAYIKKIQEMYGEIFETAKKSTIPFNSFEFNELVIKKHAYQEEMEPIDNTVNWIARNYIMIARINNAAEKHGDKRILCTVGAEHVYFYHRELVKKGYDVIFPLK